MLKNKIITYAAAESDIKNDKLVVYTTAESDIKNDKLVVYATGESDIKKDKLVVYAIYNDEDLTINYNYDAKRKILTNVNYNYDTEKAAIEKINSCFDTNITKNNTIIVYGDSIVKNSAFDALRIIIDDGSCKWIVIDTRDITPVGRVVGDTILRKGYVKANGATVLREDYPRLVKFADDYRLWTTDKTNYPALFGIGDGSTTMELPDYRGRFIEMSDSDAGKAIAAGLPNITGSIYLPEMIGMSASGAFYTSTKYTPNTYRNRGDGVNGFYIFNASRSSAIYGNSTTVQPPAITMIAQIKY